MSNPAIVYRCPACRKMHEHRYQAEKCCTTMVESIWSCGECGKLHGNYSQAVSCCWFKDDVKEFCKAGNRFGVKTERFYV